MLREAGLARHGEGSGGRLKRCPTGLVARGIVLVGDCW